MQPDMKNYLNYSIKHERRLKEQSNKSSGQDADLLITKLQNSAPRILRPKLIKPFYDMILAIEFMTRSYFLYMTPSKIYIYKGIVNGELFKTISTPNTCILDSYSKNCLFESKSLYSYCLSRNQEEILKLVATYPNPDDEKDDRYNAIRVHDFIDDANSFTNDTIPWRIGDMQLDKSGKRLVVVSLDGFFINLY